MAGHLNWKTALTVAAAIAAQLAPALVDMPGAVGIVAGAVVALLALRAQPPVKAAK